MSGTGRREPDVVIVGGGIVGSFLGYLLAREGVRVTIIDPHPGAGASSGNAGILASSYCIPMSNPSVLLAGATSLFGSDPAVTLSRPMPARTLAWLLRFAYASRPGRAKRDAAGIYADALRSLDLYDAFGTEENVDLGLRRTGWLYVARSRAVLDAQLKLAAGLASLGVRHVALDPGELAALEPAVARGQVGGVHFTEDVSLDPAAVTQAVLAAAIANGAVVHHESVVAVTRSHGRVTAVRTDAGRAVSAAEFVIAAGGDSAQLGRLFGVALRIERGYGWSLVLPTDTPMARHALMGADEHVVINPGPASVRITGGMEFGGGSEAIPAPARINHLRSAAEQILPELKKITAAGSAWRGARPMTPSGVPIVERVAENVIAVAGHGTLGMTLAPASAERAVQIISSRQHDGSAQSASDH